MGFLHSNSSRKTLPQQFSVILGIPSRFDGENLLIGEQNQVQSSTAAQLLHPAALLQPGRLHLVHEQLSFHWFACCEIEIVFDEKLHGRVANSVLSGEFSYAYQ